MQIAELAGRAFGKTARLRGYQASGVVVDEMAGARKHHKEPGEHWLNKPTEQSAARIAATKVRTRREQRLAKRRTRLACPHAIVRHKAAPHPRYGSAVPHFISWTEPLTEPHDCISGRFR